MPTLSSVKAGQEQIVRQNQEATERRQQEAAQAREAAARELATDGQFVGPNGVHPTREAAGAFTPADGQQVSDRPVYFVNGIRTNAAEHGEAAQALADRTRQPVHAIHNATEGTFRDLRQAVQDRSGAVTPATRTLSQEITRAVERGEPMEIHGHSQGAIQVSTAIGEVRNNLIRGGMSPEQADQRLSNLNVHTYGGAATQYPDGPRYTHHINSRDPVANNFGLGTTATPGLASRGMTNPNVRPGRGAVFDRQQQPGDPHAFAGYLQWAVPQAQPPQAR